MSLHNKTQRTCDEKALQVALAYRATVEGSHHLVFALDRDYRFLLANPTFLQYYNLTKEQVVGRHASEVFNPETFLNEIRPHLDRALRGEEVPHETWADYPGPGRRYMLILNYPLRDTDGSIIGVSATVRDITERKQMEEQIANQARVLSTIMDNTGAMLVYLDRNFNFVMANKAYVDSCGHTWEELKGRNHFQFFPNAENEAIFKRARDSGEPISFHDKAFEYVHQPWRGVTYWDWTLVPVKDNAGTVMGLVFSLNETTERKMTERALRESEKRFRKFFELGLVGMAIESPDGDWIEINDRLCEMFGYSKDELLERHWKDFTHPKDLEEDICLMQQLHCGELDHCTLEKRFIRKDGEVINCVVSVGGYRDQDRKLLALYVLAIDITEQRKNEEALARAKEELERKVRERTRELRELAHRLVTTQEQERELIGNELHDEIGQLLTYAILLIDRAERKPEDGTLGEAKTVVRDSLAKIRNLTALLSPAHLKSGGLLQAVQTLCEDYARRTGINVDLDHSETVDGVPEDVALAGYRIVQEALTNVLRHAKASEVKVRISLEGGVLRLEVTDNGIGFDSSTTKKSTGLTGMRERALALNGRLTINSQVGQGTQIVVDIPAPG